MSTVSILFGGPSPEHDISILTGLLCQRTLATAGVETQGIYWQRDGGFALVRSGLEASDFLDGAPADAEPLELTLSSAAGFTRRGRLRPKPVDVGTVLNCCHGGIGEGGGLNAVLELAGIPSTGGPSQIAALGMDKLAFASFADGLGLRSLPRWSVAPGMVVAAEGPFILKPRFGGSSLGIEVVADVETAISLTKTSPYLRSGAVLEPFMEHAADLNLAYATHPSLVLSPLERPIKEAGKLYDYASKYLQGEGMQSSHREFPAQVPETTAAEAQRFATELVTKGGFTGIGRIDFLYVDETLYLNEINTIPGAMALYLWQDENEAAGRLASMLDGARAYRPASSSTPNPGAALSSAAGISAKLQDGWRS